MDSCLTVIRLYSCRQYSQWNFVFIVFFRRKPKEQWMQSTIQSHKTERFSLNWLKQKKKLKYNELHKKKKRRAFSCIRITRKYYEHDGMDDFFLSFSFHFYVEILCSLKIICTLLIRAQFKLFLLLLWEKMVDLQYSKSKFRP